MYAALIGRRGSGKSYEAVARHVINTITSGRMIITNLPLQLEMIEAYFPGTSHLIKLVVPTKDNPRPFSTPKDYITEWRHPETGQGPIVIVDEAHKSLSRRFATVEVLEFHAESRHAGIDCRFITQGIRKLHPDLVDLIDITYRFSKARMFGTTNSYIRKVIDGTSGAPMNTTIEKYNSDYFKFYKSHTQSDSDVAEDEDPQFKSFWHHWTIWGSGICLIIVLFMGFQGYLNPFRVKEPVQVQSVPVPEVLPVVDIQSIHDSHFKNEGLTNVGISSNEVNTPIQAIEPPPPKPSQLDHPFHSVQLHVAGTLSNNNKMLTLFFASQNGQKVFNLTSDQLSKAGYTLKFIELCAYEIDFPATGYHEYLTCNLPQIAMAPSKI